MADARGHGERSGVADERVERIRERDGAGTDDGSSTGGAADG